MFPKLALFPISLYNQGPTVLYYYITRKNQIVSHNRKITRNTYISNLILF